MKRTVKKSSAHDCDRAIRCLGRPASEGLRVSKLEYWNGEEWVPLKVSVSASPEGTTYSWAPAPSDWQRGGVIETEDGQIKLDDMYHVRKVDEE